MTGEDQKAKLKRDGYLVIKNFFSDTEIAQLRSLCLSDQFDKLDNGAINSDVMAHKQFRDIILTEKLVTTLKGLISEDLYYMCEGTAWGEHKPRSEKILRAFHMDARGDDNDLSKDYPLYRLGIYLQDMDEYSDGLKLRPGSHKKFWINITHETKVAFYRCVKYFLKYKKLPSIDLSPGINLSCKAGDLVMWNLRTHHSGHARRLKLFPKLSLYPYMESLFPDSWFIKPKNERCIVFIAFGGNSSYLTNYFYHISTIEGNQVKWAKSDYLSPDLIAKAGSLKIKLLYNSDLLSDAGKAECMQQKFMN